MRFLGTGSSTQNLLRMRMHAHASHQSEALTSIVYRTPSESQLLETIPVIVARLDHGISMQHLHLDHGTWHLRTRHIFPSNPHCSQTRKLNVLLKSHYRDPLYHPLYHIDHSSTGPHPEPQIRLRQLAIELERKANMSINKLPTELHSMIAEYLDCDTRSLSALSQVSKYYRDVAEPCLYRYLVPDFDRVVLEQLLLTFV